MVEASTLSLENVIPQILDQRVRERVQIDMELSLCRTQLAHLRSNSLYMSPRGLLTLVIILGIGIR